MLQMKIPDHLLHPERTINSMKLNQIRLEVIARDLPSLNNPLFFFIFQQPIRPSIVQVMNIYKIRKIILSFCKMSMHRRILQSFYNGKRPIEKRNVFEQNKMNRIIPLRRKVKLCRWITHRIDRSSSSRVGRWSFSRWRKTSSNDQLSEKETSTEF